MQASRRRATAPVWLLSESASFIQRDFFIFPDSDVEAARVQGSMARLNERESSARLRALVEKGWLRLPMNILRQLGRSIWFLARGGGAGGGGKEGR